MKPRTLKCSTCGWECKEGTPYKGAQGSAGTFEKGTTHVCDRFEYGRMQVKKP